MFVCMCMYVYLFNHRIFELMQKLILNIDLLCNLLSYTTSGCVLSLFCEQHSRQTVPVLWRTRAQQRWASSLPMNTVVLFVPQQEAWVVERMGRFHRILEPVSSHLFSTNSFNIYESFPCQIFDFPAGSKLLNSSLGQN